MYSWSRFYLNVEDSVRVQIHPLCLLGIGGKVRLIVPFDVRQGLQHGGIIGIVVQLPQDQRLHQVVLPAGQIPDQAVQAGLISLSQRRWSIPLVTLVNFQGSMP